MTLTCRWRCVIILFVVRTWPGEAFVSFFCLFCMQIISFLANFVYLKSTGRIRKLPIDINQHITTYLATVWLAPSLSVVILSVNIATKKPWEGQLDISQCQITTMMMLLMLMMITWTLAATRAAGVFLRHESFPLLLNSPIGETHNQRKRGSDLQSLNRSWESSWQRNPLVRPKVTTTKTTTSLPYSCGVLKPGHSQQRKHYWTLTCQQEPCTKKPQKWIPMVHHFDKVTEANPTSRKASRIMNLSLFPTVKMLKSPSTPQCIVVGNFKNEREECRCFWNWYHTGGNVISHHRKLSIQVHRSVGSFGAIRYITFVEKQSQQGSSSLGCHPHNSVVTPIDPVTTDFWCP
jgi:hypothetical protein